MKCRIWEKKEGKCAKPLAKIQATAIFLKQDMRRNVLFEFIEICIDMPCCNDPFWVEICYGNTFSEFSCPYNAFDLCEWQLFSFLWKTYELFVIANVYMLLSTAPVLCRHFIPTPSPQQHSHSDTSPRLSPCSDNASSASDYDSEPDQVSTHYEQPPTNKNKRQRTTFSPLEVWELERAYMRQPYLTDKDEEDLVQRLGIKTKSLKVKDLLLLQNRFSDNLANKLNKLGDDISVALIKHVRAKFSWIDGFV